MSNPEGWKIALERIAAEKEAKTGFLDLRLLGLTEPPESLFELEHLKRLNLGWDFFDSGGNYRNAQSDIETNTIGAAFAKLKNLSQLQRLYRSGTQVSDLMPLRELTQLQSLDCSSTKVSDLTPLRELTQLQTLDCRATQVSDLTPLRELTQLQSLDCSFTQVLDLTPLRELTQLQSLYCNNTQVSDLTPLRELTQLQTLGCYNTHPFQGLFSRLFASTREVAI